MFTTDRKNMFKVCMFKSIISFGKLRTMFIVPADIALNETAWQLTI